MIDHDLNKLKVAELRRELSLRGLDTKGVKAALVKRLRTLLNKELKDTGSSTLLFLSEEKKSTTDDDDDEEKNEIPEVVQPDIDSPKVHEELKLTESPASPEEYKTSEVMSEEPLESASLNVQCAVSDVSISPGDASTTLCDNSSGNGQKSVAREISEITFRPNLDVSNTTELSETADRKAEDVVHEVAQDDIGQSLRTGQVLLDTSNLEQTPAESVPAAVTAANEHQETSDSCGKDTICEDPEGTNVHMTDGQKGIKRKVEDTYSPSSVPGIEITDAKCLEKPRRTKTRWSSITMKVEKTEQDDGAVTLDLYNSDLNLVIDASHVSAHPLTNEGFAFMWAGARATHGVSKGKICFEVKVVKQLDVSHLPADEPNPHVVRLGFSVESTSMQLGEEPLSYGYGGTGKISVNCQFKDYGMPFQEGDIISAFLNMDSDPVEIGFAKNGRFLGSAYKIPKHQLQGKALYPHVLTKNSSFELNFGQKDQPMCNLPEGFQDYVFIGNVPADLRERGTRVPERREDCEMIMMCGLPGSGKSVWAADYSLKNPDKKYNVLGTNNIIDKMKVMGLPRKRNYHGRWDVLIQMSTKCLNKLFEIGSKLRRNYILDQTNVYPTAQRRKMRNFEGFKRKAVVVVPTEEEYKRRCDKRDREEGKEIPDHAVLEMKANFKLPEVSDIFDEVVFTELQRDDSEKLVKVYNEEGKSAVGPASKRFRPNEQSAGGRGGRNSGGFDRERGGERERGGGSGGGAAATGRGGFNSPGPRNSWGDSSPSQGGFGRRSPNRGGFVGSRGFDGPSPGGGRGGFGGGSPGGFGSGRGGGDYGGGSPGYGDHSPGGFGRGSRGGFPVRGGRGGFGGGSDRGREPFNDDGFGRDSGYGGEPRGGFDRDAGPRGGFDRDSGPRGGFDRDSGSRGGFDRDSGPRGGFDRDSGPRGGFDRDGGPRGGFDRDSGPRGGFDRDSGHRGGFDRGGGPRGGFDRDSGPRGGFGDGGPRGGFGDGGSRGGFRDGGSRGGFRDSGSRGGFRDGGSRGGFGDSGPRGAFGDSGPRGGFGDSEPRRGFGDGGPRGGGGYGGSNNDYGDGPGFGKRSDSGYGNDAPQSGFKKEMPGGYCGESGGDGYGGQAASEGGYGGFGGRGGYGSRGGGYVGRGGYDGGNGGRGAASNRGYSGGQGGRGGAGRPGNRGAGGNRSWQTDNQRSMMQPSDTTPQQHNQAVSYGGYGAVKSEPVSTASAPTSYSSSYDQNYSSYNMSTANQGYQGYGYQSQPQTAQQSSATTQQWDTPAATAPAATPAATPAAPAVTQPTPEQLQQQWTQYYQQQSQQYYGQYYGQQAAVASTTAPVYGTGAYTAK